MQVQYQEGPNIFLLVTYYEIAYFTVLDVMHNSEFETLHYNLDSHFPEGDLKRKKYTFGYWFISLLRVSFTISNRY